MQATKAPVARRSSGSARRRWGSGAPEAQTSAAAGRGSYTQRAHEAGTEKTAANSAAAKRKRTPSNGPGINNGTIPAGADTGSGGSHAGAATGRNKQRRVSDNTATAIQRMLGSQRRKCVRFCPQFECFKFKDRSDAARLATADGTSTLAGSAGAQAGEVTLRGLKPSLRRACYPNYSYKRAQKTGATQFASQRESTGLSGPWQGTARGRNVHEQVCCYVNEGQGRWLQRYTMSCSPYVRRLVRALALKRLVPLVAEFEDFYAEYRIGSSIDLLCIDEKYGGLAVIEVKVGGENYFDRGNGNIIRPAALRKFPNSPLNQARLQLLFYRKMIADHYPYVELGRCLVAQIKFDAVHFHKLPQEFISSQDALFRAVVRQPQSARGRRRPARSRAT